MSTMARPRRRLPARVYWFRRFLVLGVALGLVFGIAQLLGGSAPGSEDAARVVGAEPSERASAPRAVSTADADPRGTAKEKKSRKKKAEEKTPLPEPSGPCPEDDLVVTPVVHEPAYAGHRVRFSLEVTTRATPACTWEVSPASLVVKLTSGDDRIWSSQDCPVAVPSAEVVARQEKPGVVRLGWRGQRSDSSCSRTTPWAQPGWYHVTAAAFGAEPTDVQFELRPPVPETITPKPKPEKDSKEKRGNKPSERPSGRD